MHKGLYAAGVLLLGAVFGVLAVTWTWQFAFAAGLSFLLGFLIERGVLSRSRITASLPFEVQWKSRVQTTKAPPPLGVLDWELAFNTEGKRMARALGNVTQGMQAMSKVMSVYGPRFEAAKEESAEHRVRLSRDFARKVRPHVGRMDRAEAEAGSAIRGFRDSFLKRVQAFPPDVDLAPIRASIAGLLEATNQSLPGVKSYRDAVAKMRRINLQQDTNEVLDQLLVTADKLVDDVGLATEMADTALTEIDGRASTTGVSRAERRRRGKK